MTGTGQGRGRARALFLSGLQIHPTLSGGNLRSHALASGLLRQGLDVFVYSLVGRKQDYLARRPSGVQSWPEGIEEYVDRGALGFLAQFGSYRLGLPPLWITACLRTAAATPGARLLPALLREKLAACDVIVADFPFLYPIFSAAPPRVLRVLSTHNLEHQLYRGALRAAVRAVEVRAALASDLLVSCCRGDREFFLSHAGAARSVLVPNGIDLRRFRGLAEHREAARAALGIAPHVKLLLFTASKYGPNREAFEYLRGFAEGHPELLASLKLHLLVVGSVTAAPQRLPGFTATGRVEAVEPYFAAADAALNPIASGAGTNVKVCEFLAARLPIVSTRFGARGFLLEDGRTALLFEKDGLAAALSELRRLFDEDPARLRRMAEDAYAANESGIDMDASVERLVAAMHVARATRAGAAAHTAAFAGWGMTWRR